jgi:hypothetical protein
MTHDEHLIALVRDADKIRMAKAAADAVADTPLHLSLSWIAKNRWAAVPVESGLPFGEREAEWFAKATELIECYQCLVVATEPMPPSAECYLVATTQDGFLEVRRVCFGFNYIVLPEDESFAILLTTEDYYVVAGPKEFVEKAIGSTIQTARKIFFNFCNDDHWPKDTRDRLLEVFNRYQPYDGD